jgi:hypothetical protein
MSSVLEPLLTELHLSRETIAAQAERLGYTLAERDVARSEVERLLATATATDAPTKPAPPETHKHASSPFAPLWARLWPVLGLPGAVVVALTLALVFVPR